MRIIERILLTGGDRRGRLKDYRGNSVLLGRLLRNGPRAAATGAMRLLANRLPRRPWISYDGQSIIDRHLGPHSRVLEFGSGMSTSWYADRAGYVLSLEDDRAWFDRASVILSGHSNIDYRFCASAEDYYNPALADNEPFDLIMVDGTARDRCVNFALERLAPGGILYLDNSDMFGDSHTGNVPAARAALHDQARNPGYSILTLTDFAPTQLFVNETTMLIRGAAPQLGRDK